MSQKSTYHSRKQWKTNDRITVEALLYYVPLFKMGDSAEQKILEGNLLPEDRNFYEAQARFKELSLRKITSLSGPLITSEINKLISSSHIPYSDDLFDILFYAGAEGITKGLRKFDDKKLNSSATNYLFQWFVVYAKRELAIIEAPYGIPPSRFQKYKKISAVRKKLAAERDAIRETDIIAEVTNDEVYEYFQSGQADVKTMNGRVKKKNVRSQANKDITIELVAEQDEFEKKYMNTQLIDPLDDYSFEIKFSKEDAEPFSQTIFGVFVENYNVSDIARAILLSELGSKQISEDDEKIVSSMTEKNYKLYASAWKGLIKDPSGPFYDFLNEMKNQEFNQFDINSTLQTIESNGRKPKSKKYHILFKKERESI